MTSPHRPIHDDDDGDGRASPPLTLRVLGSIHEVPQAAWDALLTERSSPFVEWQWLACLEDSGSVGEGTGWLPRPFALYEGERLIAAAPAYVKLHSEGEFVFDWSWADVAAQLGVEYYPKLVFAVPFTPATGDRVLVEPALPAARRAEVIAAVADAAARLCAELGLSSAHALFVRDDEASAWGHARYVERHGIQFHWKNQDFTTFEGFLSSLPSKKRTQVRRERAQLARDGVELRTARPEELTAALAREMHALYLTTVDKFVYGRRYLTVRFFELVAERFAGRLAWALARRDGELIASAFNVKRGGVLYGRYWGTHVDLPFLHFNVCFYHGIDEAIREGLHTFEPGAGGEHKRLRGFRPTLTRSMHRVRDPRLARLIEPFLARERAAIARHLAEDDAR
ncbi:MAG TPA: GNAT family N-acetyltransferase [Polyangiaceae bacterium]|nr:GNAT family N-acetyltransferase [Polyangiaceae bacterium]